MKSRLKENLSLGRANPRKSAYLLQYVSSRLKESTKFWRACLKVARAHPELCAEEVEYKAVLVTLGMFPFSS